MLIVVTGSSGRLGRFVVRDLLEQGHDVRPIDLRPAVDPAATIPLTRLIDLTRAADLIPIFRGADAVCHLGNAPAIREFPLTDGLANNVAATHGVFEAAAAAGVKRIINASSIQAYGVVTSRPDVAPTPPLYLPVDEDHPLLPRDAYPLSKAIGERIAESFARRLPEMSVFSLRFTHITEKSPVPAGAEAIGASLLTAIHREDAAIAVRLCCGQDRPGHTALNILSPASTVPWERSWLGDFYGCQPEFRRELNPDDALIACDRARQILGFTARRVAAAVAADAVAVAV
jgi:nucleoside-diphosphate-sugar epimerase